MKKKTIKVLVAHILATISIHDCWSQCKHFSSSVYFQWLKHQSRNYWSGGVIFLFVVIISLSFFLLSSFIIVFFFFYCLLECILFYVFTVSHNLYKKNHSQKKIKKRRVAVKYLFFLTQSLFCIPFTVPL